MSELIKRRAAAAKAFNSIGKTSGSAPPDSTSNTFGIAYELFIAEHLRSMASARYDAAKEAATLAGVIQSDYDVGTHVPFNADGLQIVAKRNKDSTALDKALLSNNLVKDFKLTQPQVAVLLTKSSKPKKGATTHSFSVDD
jgi:hypothetical protein